MITCLKKFIVDMLLSVCILGVCAGNASIVYAADYYTRNNHHMTGYGVGNYGKNTQKYFVVNSKHNHQTVIDNAMSEWINTTSRLNYTTPISFKKTTNRANSVIDFMNTGTTKDNDGHMHSAGVLAWTEYYIVGGKQVSADKQNWKYCYVKLYCSNYDDLSANGRKGTAAHEIGHCFGLAHNNGNKKSIMCQTREGRSVSSAQKCDLKGINYLYK